MHKKEFIEKELNEIMGQNLSSFTYSITNNPFINYTFDIYHNWYFLAREYLSINNSIRLKEFEYYYTNNDEFFTSIKEYIYDYKYDEEQDITKKKQFECLIAIQYYIIKYHLELSKELDEQSLFFSYNDLSIFVDNFTIIRRNILNLKEYLNWSNLAQKYIEKINQEKKVEIIKPFINIDFENKKLIDKEYNLFYYFMLLCSNKKGLTTKQKNRERDLLKSQFIFIQTIKKINNPEI
ncbi:MAG: hypothetical protein ACPKNR_14590 [Pleomorphochaeta sp.]